MSISQKHYRDLATVLGRHNVAPTLLAEIVTWLADDNPRFSRTKFVDAIDNARDNYNDENARDRAATYTVNDNREREVAQ